MKLLAVFITSYLLAAGDILPLEAVFVYASNYYNQLGYFFPNILRIIISIFIWRVHWNRQRIYLLMGLATILLIPLVFLSGSGMTWYYMLFYSFFYSIFIIAVHLNYLLILDWDLNNVGKLAGIGKWISALFAVTNACDSQNIWLPVTMFIFFGIYFFKETRRIKELAFSSHSTSENEVDPIKSIYPKTE